MLISWDISYNASINVGNPGMSAGDVFATQMDHLFICFKEF